MNSTRGVSGKGTVLLVDDEETVRRALARMLEVDRQRVLPASTGKEALALLASHAASIDVVVTDISMPQMDGVELLHAIREKDLDLPVILITGAPALDTALAAIRDGAFDYVEKPGLERLREVVSRAIGLGRLARLKRAAMEAASGESAGASDLAGLDAAFERAIGSLWAAFQPILDRNGATYGHESLMRSREPSLPHPGAVLDAAERLGRIDELGITMRGLSAVPVAAATESGVLFVNLHPRDLEHPSLLDPNAPLAAVAKRVVLEITERASLGGIADVPNRIAQLRALGYRIAIDDLGAGYAGLTSFAVLEPDVVKLDMTLVRDTDTKPTKQKVIASLCGLCHELGMLVVAEGIETPGELACVRELGCDLFQGFALARPGPPFPTTTWPLARTV